MSLRYRSPLIGGCIGGALGGIVVSLTDLAALGFGTTVLLDIALADPTNNGYTSYIIAHAVAIVGQDILAIDFDGIIPSAGVDIQKYEEYPCQGTYKLCFTSQSLDSIGKTRVGLGDRFDFVVHPYGKSTSCFNGRELD